MREIKFRAFWKKRKKMCRVRDIENMHLMFDEWHFKIEDKEYNDIFINGNGMIIMQFTGLKDKNGKEIYEGDIIINGDYGITTIKFEDGKFYAEEGEEWGWIESDCEVIGNIYENKELLNESS